MPWEQATVAPAPDDGRQHGERDVVDLAHSQARHHEVLEHVDARTHLGHALERIGEGGGRRRAHAHDGTRVAPVTQCLGRGDYRVALAGSANTS